MAEETQASQGIQANENSIAIGGISIGGNVGDIRIGHTIGFTSDQVSTLITQISTTFQVKPFDGRCPYKGLEVFGEEDSELFFGRETWIENLLSRIKESRTLFVTGQSGSGKSSLVRAGLIPNLKKSGYGEHWLYATMKPGRDPVEALATAFSRLKDPSLGKYLRENAGQTSVLQECAESVLSERTDQRLVIFIDQFEEVFTQLSKDRAQIFINLLDHAATVENGRVIILFSMRSDFVPNCATFPQLNAILNQQFVQIGAMQPEELVSAIAQPALRVGLKIDPDLIAQIINDMKGEPGALPLMQFALKDLFHAEQAKGGMIALTLSDYLEHGGINQALERHANASLEKLTDEEKELARSVFSGLIEIGRGTQDTRRTALSNELIPAGAQADAVRTVVQKLASARLITTDATTVTISHEKLIDAWPWLKKLVNENRDVIALQNEIAADAKEWEEHKRDSSYLYSGARLATAREKMTAQKLMLSGLAQDFVEQSIALQEAERKARETLRRRITLGLVVGMIALAALAVFGFYQAGQSNKNAVRAQDNASTAEANLVIANTAQANANIEKQKAEEQAQIALARQLAAQAQSLIANKPELAKLLAIKSMQLFPDGAASQVIQTNLAARYVSGISYEAWATSVAFSPDGKYIVSGGCDKVEGNFCTQGTARVWPVNSGKALSQVSYAGEVSAVAFSPDGKYVASGGCDKYDSVNPVCTQSSVRVWLVNTGKEVARMEYVGMDSLSDSRVNSAVFSPDGKYVLSVAVIFVDVWIANSGKEIARETYSTHATSAAFSSDGKYVVSAGDNIAHVWVPDTGKEIFRKVFGDDPSFVNSQYVTFSPDGKYVAAASGGTVYIWDAITGNELASKAHDDSVFVTFSPDGNLIASGEGFSWGSGGSSQTFSTLVWEPRTGKEITRLTHDRGQGMKSISFTPDSKYIVSGSGDLVSRVWESYTGKVVAYIGQPSNSVAFSPNGKYFALGGGKAASVWAIPTGIEIFRETSEGSVVSATFNPDGRYVISGGCDKYDETSTCIQSSIHVREADSGKEVSHLIADNEIVSIAISSDGKYIAAVGCAKWDLEIRNECTQGSTHVWATDTSIELSHVQYDKEVSFVAFSPNVKYILSISDRTAQVWDMEAKKEVSHMTDVLSSVFSPDSKAVASIKCDKYDTDIGWLCIQGSIHTWATNTGDEISNISPGGAVTTIAFSPDGKYIISGGCDKYASTDCIQGTTYVWETNTGAKVSHTTYTGVIKTVAFSPVGEYFAMGVCVKKDETVSSRECTEASIQVMSLKTGNEISHTTYDGLANIVSFSSDGKYVISGGCDKYDTVLYWQCIQATARVWITVTGQEVARMTHANDINSVAFSPDGKYIVSTSADQTTRVWLYQPADIITNACEGMSRNLTRAEWDQYIGDATPYQAVCGNLPIEPEVTATPTVTP